MRLLTYFRDRPWIVLLALMMFIFLLRLPLAQQYLGFTSDQGSYLMTRNYVLGDDPTGYLPMHFRPPLIGYILLLPTWLMGDLMGSKVLAILSGVLMGPAVYLLGRRYFPPWVSLLFALAIVLAPTMGEMTAGGYISVLVITPFCLGLAWIHELATMEKPGWWHWVKPAVALLVVAGLNQSAWPFWGLTAGAIALGSTYWKRGILGCLLAGIGGVAPWGWFLLANTPTDYYQPGYAPFFLHVSMNGIFADAWAIPLMICAWRAKQRDALWLGIIGFTIGSMAFMNSSSYLMHHMFGRAAFYAPLPIILGWAVLWYRWLFDSPILVQVPWRWAMIPILAVMVGVGQWGWMGSFNVPAKTINMLGPDEVAALDWIKANTPKDEKIFVHPNGLGWYAGGYSRRGWFGSYYVPPKAEEGVHAAWVCAMGWPHLADSSGSALSGWRTNDPGSMGRVSSGGVIASGGAACDPLALLNYNVSRILAVEHSWAISLAVPEGGWDAARYPHPWLKEDFRSGNVVVYSFVQSS